MKQRRTPTQPVPELPLPDQLKDIAWVQDFLQVSKNRVFQLIRDEGLPHYKWDRTLRFHPHAIARWLAAQQQSA